MVRWTPKKHDTSGDRSVINSVYRQVWPAPSEGTEPLLQPVQAFLDECCELGTEKEAKRNDLQLAWHIWCNDNGHVHGSTADFGRKLRAALPRIDDQQRRTGGRRDRWYVGVGLTSDAHADIARARNGA
jgi:hypothetical protein